MRERDGTLYKGEEGWEPIIKMDEWLAVKAILEDPTRLTHDRGGLPRHLLSGIACCGRCGHKLSCRNRYGKTIYYCQNPPCRKIQRTAPPVESLITEAIFAAVESDLFARLTAQEQDDPTIQLVSELAAKQGLWDRTDDKLAREVISEATGRRQKAQLEREMEQLNTEIARKRGSQVLRHVPRNLRDVWPDLLLDRRRAIVKAVIEKVIVNPQPNAVVFDPSAIVAVWRA